MDLERLKKMIDWMATQPISELEFADGDWSVHLVKSQNGIQVVTDSNDSASISSTVDISAAQPEGVDEKPLSAPLYGVLYLSPDPASPPYVKVGDAVKAGDTLCVIESMKVFNTITADRDAVVAEFLAADGEEVSSGQPLIRLESVKP